MIPFLDLTRQYESIKEEIDRKIKSILEKGWFILGKEVNEFEESFAKYCGKDFCVGVSNGTHAIEIVLKSLDIGKEDEVITVVNTSPFTILGILNAGAKPVLMDCGEDYLINVEKIEEKITSKTKAIIPVHLYGNVCNMDRILEIAEKYNLKVIEDCCQAHGAEYKSKKVPIGENGCFSFYPSKNLGAYGDAGAIITSNAEINEKARMLRNGGQKARDDVQFIGINSRIDELQAGILNIKLEKLDEWNEKRRKIAFLYSSLLKDAVKIPEENQESKHVYHLYVIRHEKRDNLKEYLREKGVGTGIHYPVPNHLQPAFKFLGYKERDFPIAEKYAKEILSLPCFPELKEEEIREVCEKVKEFVETGL